MTAHDKWEPPKGMVSRFRGEAVDIRTRMVVARCEGCHPTFLDAELEARALSEEHPYSEPRVVHSYVKDDADGSS